MLVSLGCAEAQERGAVPWKTTVAPTMNPLPVGLCAAVHLTVVDGAGREPPRNPHGHRVTIADFDMSVDSPGGAAAGLQIDRSHWSVCGCPGAPPGAQATITASYPSKSLETGARVPGVEFQSTATFVVGAAKGPVIPPGCTAVAPAVPPAASSQGLAPAVNPDPFARNATPISAPLVARAPAVPAAPAPVPTGITVTGAPSSAKLSWQPVPGVASFTVVREQANVPGKEFLLAATNQGMYDSELQPDTAYTYIVRAKQADGREGSATVSFTTPPVMNPAGLKAAQTDTGTVELSWQPVSDASYYVVFGPGAEGGKRVDATTLFVASAVPAGSQEWAVASYYEPGPVSSAAAAFSRVQLTLTDMLSGWVDLHTHPMVNLAFAGKLIHGGVDVGSLLPADSSCNRNIRATSIQHALGDDRPSHGGWNLLHFPCGDNARQLLIHLFQERNGAAMTASPATGYPDFEQWPKWNDITHQKMWYEWIRRAHAGGLRVMVALATNNKTLADGMSGGSPVTTPDGATDDKTSADLQLTEIKAFVLRHPDFMEVALNAADVKRIVQANKIAIVLGVEIDNIGNFNSLPVATMPDGAAQALISSEIQRLHDQGVRYIFPIHVLDNTFGGTAIYQGGFNTSNLREAGHYWHVECSVPSDDISYLYKLGTDPLDNTLEAAGQLIKLGIDPLRHPGPPPLCAPGRGHRNAAGLSNAGVIAIKEMMRRGMIVDIDHMSNKSADATLAIAEGFGYPVVSGHTGIRGQGESHAENSRTRLQLERLSKLHGMFGLGSDGTTAWRWARDYQSAMIIMGFRSADPLKATYVSGAVSFGTDLNGLVRGPKPGGSNRVKYNGNADAPWPANQTDPIPISQTGTKRWDYNDDGVAHYGMLADFVRDLRTAPSIGFVGSDGAQLGVAGTELVDQHLLRGANYFWQMWLRIEAQKASVH
jgi:microsomal dipeptidase-like Zn-dependent dipeptidase